MRLNARNPSPADLVSMPERTTSSPSPLSPASMPNRVAKVPTTFSLAMRPVMVPTVSSQLSPHPRGANMTQTASPNAARMDCASPTLSPM